MVLGKSISMPLKLAEFRNLISCLLFGTVQNIIWQMRINAYLSYSNCFASLGQI
jgi:hypothetical protein